MALAVYAVVCLASLAWPLYPLLADRTRPFVLGLPFALAWKVAWIALTFLVVLAYHLITGERDRS